MNIAKIAIPSQAPGGLQSARSQHFGHCDLFTLVDVADGRITGVQVVDNIAHGTGGCHRPVELLRENRVNTIVVAGMGARPLQRFAEAGIRVLHAPRHFCDDVQSLVDGFINDAFAAMQENQTCRGHGKCHR